MPGYTHVLANSRFDLGSLVDELDELGMHQVVGTDGTFATELVSGAAVGTHDNVPFPDPSTGVYPGGADAQNAAVESYFVTAGLPQDQIASVSADEAVFMQGQDVLAGWYSILHRGWDGIPIDDSIANAAFEADGRSFSEQVYWPQISGEVLAQVRALQDMLQDPARRNAYLNKLPASSRDVNIVIRHTPWYWQGSFQAQACCRGPNPGNACFDIDGELVRLPGDDGNGADGNSGDAATSDDDSSSDGGSSGADTGSPVVCPTSDSGRFFDLPSGDCSGPGSCAIELDNVCRPGVAYASPGPQVFDCQCVANQWQCDLVSGGMGLVPCSDAGAADQ